MSGRALALRGSAAARPARSVRGGWLDALLVGTVVLAVWTQTPVGAVLGHAARFLGFDVEVPSLVARFEVDALWAPSGALVVSGPATTLDLTWPVAGEARVSSTFGMRVHPVYGDLRFHNGVDLAVPIGTPVHAAREGVVATVAEDERSGRYVVIAHPGGLRTAYCHLSEVDLAPGDAVGRGQEFARSGNTGRSTGPHLHFVVRVNGEAVDPLTWVPEVVAQSGV